MFFLADNVCSDATVLQVMGIVRLIMNVICIVIPIVLIIIGSFDLFKAVTAAKEDKIKESQKILIKRIIAAVIVFLVPTIVTVLMNLIGVNEWKTCWNEADGSFKEIFDPNSDL